MTNEELNKKMQSFLNEAQIRVEVARTRWEAAYGFPAAHKLETTNLQCDKRKEEIEQLLQFAALVTKEAIAKEVANRASLKDIEDLFSKYE